MAMAAYVTVISYTLRYLTITGISAQESLISTFPLCPMLAYRTRGSGSPGDPKDAEISWLICSRCPVLRAD
jgi:hypothetical protein